MKLLIRLFSLLIIVFSMVSCDNDDDKVPKVTFKATLNGISEVPSNASAAIGLATLTYNPYTKVFSIGITHNLAASTAEPIHKGATGFMAKLSYLS